MDGREGGEGTLRCGSVEIYGSDDEMWEADASGVDATQVRVKKEERKKDIILSAGRNKWWCICLAWSDNRRGRMVRLQCKREE